MKAKLVFVIVLVVIFIWVTYLLETIPTTPEVATSQFFTPVYSTSTIQWISTATPLNLPLNKSDEIISIIDRLHPYKCIKENLLTVNPTPIEPAMQVSRLKFTEITALPEPKPNYVNERADNIDNSRTAFIGCQPRNCGKLYVKDNRIDKLYQIKFGATTDRPLDYLQWINKDTVIVAQQGHLWTLIVAINVDKQQFEYYGITAGCNATSTP